MVKTKEEKKSLMITTVIHLVILALLFLYGLKYLDPPIEKGIAINFGTTDYGSGDVQPTEVIKTAPVEASSSQPEIAANTSEDKVLTQETEEAPVINNKEKEVKETKVVKEEVKEVVKSDPKPDKSTTDVLSSFIDGPKNDGKAQGGEGNDSKAGDKGSRDGDPNANSYYGMGVGLDGDGNYRLGGRKALVKKIIVQDCNQEGIVVVDIDVDRQGNVIKALAGVKGTTNNSKCLLEPARQAALQTKFNPDEKAPARQIGQIIYHFKLSE